MYNYENFNVILFLNIFLIFQSIFNYVLVIYIVGNRIIASDVQDSFYFVRYKRQENQLIVFVDDINLRWITVFCFLDYNIVVGVDKFGNIIIVSFIVLMKLIDVVEREIYIYKFFMVKCSQIFYMNR